MQKHDPKLTLALFSQPRTISEAIAAMPGISRRTISDHVRKFRAKGLIVEKANFRDLRQPRYVMKKIVVIEGDPQIPDR